MTVAKLIKKLFKFAYIENKSTIMKTEEEKKAVAEEAKLQPEEAGSGVNHEIDKESEEELKVIQEAVGQLKTVYDPEIPVNVYDLGLIYKVDYETSNKTLHVDMTLTAPHCPAADFIMEDVRQKLMDVKGPEKVDLRLVFEPEWNQDMMSEEAKLELGYL